MTMHLKFFCIILFLATLSASGQDWSTKKSIDNKNGLLITNSPLSLNIPVRSDDAIEGSDFAKQITGLSLEERESAIVKEVLSGNIPAFSRLLKPIMISRTIGAETYELTFYTVTDYLSIGSEEDYFYVPMTPSTAQFLADQLDCSLPTKKIVDLIYRGADLKLDPQPIPPSNKMTTVPVFFNHTDSIKGQIEQISYDRSSSGIVAGHKKDIIISKKIYSSDRSYERVVIYGWHLSDYNPIQPVYNGHIADYADYSHGIRLISEIAIINQDTFRIAEILQNDTLNILLSNEGKILKPYYPASSFLTSNGESLNNIQLDFKLFQNYPNPFNPKTNINFYLAQKSYVNVSVFDVIGSKISTLVNGIKNKGSHEIQFDGSKLSSNTYYYVLNYGSSRISKKMVLVK